MGFFSQLINNMELILLALVIAFGIILGIDKFFFEKTRKALFEDFQKSHPEFESLPPKEQEKQKEKLLKGPYFAELARELLGVLILVFLLRAFIGEPFRIPSGSLLPTLQIGDWVAVTRYNYDISTPIWPHSLIKTGEVKRGDIIVFHFPVDPHVDFIKRVIGVPGDKISYINKVLSINGQPQNLTYVRDYPELSNSLTEKSKEYTEHLQGDVGQIAHSIFLMPSLPAQDFYNLSVPQGEYFVMGDNRDFSEDSRYWGFVKRSEIVGRARFIFWSWDDHYRPRFSRIGQVIR
jgi:signal peptidase I